MDILLVAMIAIGLPLIAAMISTVRIWNSYTSLLEETEEEDWELVEKYREEKPKIMIFLALQFPSVMYGILCTILLFFASENISTTLLADLSISVAILIGVSGFMANIGTGLISVEAAKIIPKDPMQFGRYTIFAVLPHTMAIHGLLLAILFMTFTGALGAEEANLAPSFYSGYLPYIAMIYAPTSVSGALSGYLSTKGGPLEGSFEKVLKAFKKKLMFSGLGQLPGLIGLMAAVVMMINIGLF